MAPNTFGEKLKHLRKKSGKLQSDVVEDIERLFSDQIHMSQATLSALEQRQTAPKQEILEILASYYEVPITYFFDIEAPIKGKMDRAKAYLESLKQRRTAPNEFLPHSIDNSSSNEDVRRSIQNLNHWQSEDVSDNSEDFGD